LGTLYVTSKYTVVHFYGPTPGKRTLVESLSVFSVVS